MAYNPEMQSMAHLVSLCENDWSNPVANRDMLLPFGIAPLDRALYGMDTMNGEVIVVQGPEKQRKTTMVANVICHFMQSHLPVVKPHTVIDSLESGMTPRRYRDTLLAIVATQELVKAGHKPRQFCPVCSSAVCKALRISPEFLRFNTRSDEQQSAIETAMEITSQWPLHIYGANPEEGDTRNLLTSVTGSVDVQSRWRFLIENYGTKVIATDHLQQYSFFEQLSDYEKQLRAIAAVSDVVAQHQVVCLMISQVSLTSQREASSGTGKYYATGGKKAAAEATSIISVNYESGSGQVCITLEDSRKASSFSIYQPLEDVSGYFYGEATQGQKAAYRPGMEENPNPYKKGK
jgi:hypothetical protein